MSTNKKQQQPSEPVPGLTKHDIDYMMSAMVWWPDLFTAAKGKLLPEYFDRYGEAHYAVFWRSLLAIAEANGGQLPTEGLAQLVQVSTISMSEREVAPNSPEVHQALLMQGNVLHLATSYYTKQTLNRPQAFRFLNTFLYDRRIVRRLGALANQGHTSDISEKLDDLYQDAARLRGIGESEVVAATHVRSSKPGLQLQPTGIQYFDDRLGGGVSSGKVYGLLGPTGVGKTLNLVCLMVSSAIQEQIRYKRECVDKGPENARLGNFYYFVYEGDKEDIIRRCLSYLSMIPLSRLAKYELDPHMQLAGPLDPKPDYELQLFPEGVGPDGELVLSEMERYASANTVLSKNIFIREMVPNPQNPKKGCGYVQEIQSVLVAEQEAGRDVCGYYIDYAKIAAKNYCGTKLDNLRHLIGGMPMECVKFVNSYLPRAHGWIANQFNTEANRRSPTWVPHHSYSSEAGDFGDNCWFTFCLGTRSQDDNCCLINCSKHRDFQPTAPSTLYIHGSISRMICMDNLIDLDTSVGQFVHKETFDRDHKGMMIVPFRKKAGG